MSAKRKPRRENKPTQNWKNSKNILNCNKRNESVNSSNFGSNRRESGNSFLDEENLSNKSGDSSNSSDSENSSKTQKSKKNANLIITPKKKKNLNEVTENGTKTKHRKEPLPMKLRAFPQSFWQQPNKTPLVSPGNVYCVPPPLSKEDNSSENREIMEEAQPRRRQEIVSEPNIDLLFSLFRNVEDEQRKASGQDILPVIRRGRPKKSKTELKVIRDDDPYLTSSAAQSFLPLLPVRSNMESLQSKIAKEEQILAMVSIDGSASNLLTPSVNSNNQNYSQILSELVVQL